MGRASDRIGLRFRSGPAKAARERRASARSSPRSSSPGCFRSAGGSSSWQPPGLGGYHISVEGGGTSPTIIGRQSDGWSALGIVGAGVALALLPHVALAVEAHLLVTLPRTTVRFSNMEEAGRTGWPATLLSAGLLATF